MYAPEGLYWRVRHTLFPRSPGTARAATATVVDEERPVVAPSAAAAGSPMMEVRGISKAFIGLQALSDVGFDVRAGEILGIIGPNGAGKTTLFNVLNGFLLPDEGEVRWLGRRVTGRPGIIAFRGAFHGRTFGAMAVTSSSINYRVGYDPMVPSVHLTTFPAS